MKMRIKDPIRLLVVLMGLIIGMDGRATGQLFTTLYSFSAFDPITGTNSDGVHPQCTLILSESGDTLYGTASSGGVSGKGTVFAIKVDGTGFTNLHSFTSSDGFLPQGGLVLNGNRLYGTASSGGAAGKGTVFAVNTDSTGFTNLHSFTPPSEGAVPVAALSLCSDTLFGTTLLGGSSNRGTVFALKTDGTGFTNLHSFSGGADGAQPSAGLILSSNTIYGTTSGGGSFGSGTIFALSTNGTGFTNVYSFSARIPAFTNTLGVFSSNSDGAFPYGLLLSGSTLYGTASEGGSGAGGTLFSLDTNGTAFVTLHSFTANPDPSYTNSEGGGSDRQFDFIRQHPVRDWKSGRLFGQWLGVRPQCRWQRFQDAAQFFGDSSLS